jgi:hypothetical protein
MVDPDDDDEYEDEDRDETFTTEPKRRIECRMT